MTAGDWLVIGVWALVISLALLLRDRLGAVDVLVLGLRGLGVELAEVLRRGVDVVPAAVLEVDQGLVVAVDRDDAADDAGEALQLRALGVDLDVLVGPLLLQLLVAQFKGVHERKYEVRR